MKKQINNRRILKCLLMLVIIGILYCFVMYPFYEYLKEKEYMMKKHVGDTITLQKDTFVVKQYRLFTNKYILNEGIKVNRNFVEHD